MSIESAKAFCARFMSDEDYRNNVFSAPTAEAISAIINKEYDFSKDDLLKVVRESYGSRASIQDIKDELVNAVDGDSASISAVLLWIDQLQ